MKKRITLTLPVEIIKYIKAEAKRKGITASQLVEEAYRELLAREKAEEGLKKVS